MKRQDISAPEPGYRSIYCGLCFGSHSYSFDGLLAVCLLSPGVYVSAYACLKRLVHSLLPLLHPNTNEAA